MKKHGKILCLLIGLMMLLSLAPISAFAATSLYSLVVNINPVASGSNVQIEGKSQGTVAIETDIQHGEERTIYFYPATGYSVTGVTVNTESVAFSGNSITLTMDENKVVKVYFAKSGTSATGSTSFTVFKAEPVATPTGTVYKPLSGATIKLANNADASKVYTAQSDATGHAAFRNIPDGVYTLSESAAPHGYDGSSTTYTVRIDTQNPTTATSEASVIAVSPNLPVGTVLANPFYYSNGAEIATFLNRKTWQSDGVAHWKIDSASGTETNKAPHEDHDGDNVCDICAYNMASQNPSTNTVPPHTGDGSNLLLWMGMMLALPRWVSMPCFTAEGRPLNKETNRLLK